MDETPKVHCKNCKYLYYGTYDYYCKFPTYYETPLGIQSKYNLPEKKNEKYDCKDFVQATSAIGKLFRLGPCGIK
jgi:hypothetical protein